MRDRREARGLPGFRSVRRGLRESVEHVGSRLQRRRLVRAKRLARLAATKIALPGSGTEVAGFAKGVANVSGELVVSREDNFTVAPSLIVNDVRVWLFSKLIALSPLAVTVPSRISTLTLSVPPLVARLE